MSEVEQSTSHSIWKEQVDEALVELIGNTIKVTDFATGNKVTLGSMLSKNKQGETVKNGVAVRKPDEDFKVETYPSITVYNIYDQFNYERFTRDPNPKVVGRNVALHQLTMQEPVKTFDLLYQIDFWANTQTHMNEMTLQWLAKFFPFHNLDVKDMSGELCNILMQKRENRIGKEDLFEGNKRIFHSFITYTIWVEINEEERYNRPMVTNVVVRGEVIQLNTKKE